MTSSTSPASQGTSRLSKRRRRIRFAWLDYLFDEQHEPTQAEAPEVTEEQPVQQTEETPSRFRRKKKREGISDTDPVSFRTVTGPITAQQAVYFAVRDVLYAMGPIFTYIGITMVCILVGFLLSGRMMYGLNNYLSERSNLAAAVAVVLTLRYLYRKSRKRGSVFFEDASLYLKDIQWHKVALGFLFGAGTALFLSAALTLIPKVWVFASYDTHVGKMYQRADILLSIIESALLTPLVEEIIFRGYMLNRLLRRWPELPALIVTTLVFSALHGSAIWFIYVFVMGWLIGRLSIREGNILYGICVHAGFNLPSVVQWFTYFLHPELQLTDVVTSTFQTILLGMIGGVAAALSFLIYKRKERNAV